MQSIASNIHTVQQRIKAAAEQAGRNPADIRLLAVSKRQSVESIRQAYSLKQYDFAENYLQEALDKMALLTDLRLRWHFIGQLQSNKTRSVAENFDWVHSVDRLKIAERLSKQRPKDKTPLQLCIQVNIDNETSKSGIPIADAANLCEAISQLPNIQLRGFMAIPLASTDPQKQRQAFAQLRTLLANCVKYSLDTLSMGMSADLEVAIAEGATIVRIGTALFGERNSIFK